MRFPNPSRFTTEDGLENRWYFESELSKAQAFKDSLDAEGYYTTLDYYHRWGQYNLVWLKPKLDST